jgi:hypothetical protein
LFAFAAIAPSVARLDPLMLIVFLLCLYSSVEALLFNARRDTKRWLVFAAGLFGMVGGVVPLALGIRALRAGEVPTLDQPVLMMLASAVLFFVTGAATIMECLSGTRVRERGIEIFGTHLPWSRIVVEDWHSREGGSDLALTIRDSRLFDMQIRRNSEGIVPVPASKRPALEAFLAEHKVTGG